mmetsp:Transcript_17570/g.47549  ORF Transcript_17570/g.47549 Transcript_17570/m.47549 type:complete len:119 (-) Transcript_17570:637-993(-)
MATSDGTNDADVQNEKLKRFLCEQCEGIPEPSESFMERLKTIFRTVFFQLGYGWETPIVPDGVTSVHDLVVRFITNAELERVGGQMPLPEPVSEEMRRCLRLASLQDRVLLIANTASK